MTRSPTGRVIRTSLGRALVLERTFRAPIEDVWASLTESARLERWIGRWEGEPGAGRSITFTMTAEEGAAPEQVRIVACDPPRLLQLVLAQGPDGWHVTAELSESEGITTLTFSQRVGDGDDISDVGPGWEYYLDRLVADRAGTPLPEWDEYYPAQRDHYQRQSAAAG